MARRTVVAPSCTSVLLRSLEQTGIRKGLFGNSRAWMYLGTGLWTVRTLRRFAGRKTEILISEELKPGQRIIIANGSATIDGAPDPVPSGRRRRRA